jgi:hypothetical protein
MFGEHIKVLSHYGIISNLEGNRHFRVSKY